MVDMIKLFINSCLIFSIIGCSQLLETVNLNIDTEDKISQETFNVVEKTLTLREARLNRDAPYPRFLIQTGKGSRAQVIPEKIALASSYPKYQEPTDYLIGRGDLLKYIRILDNKRGQGFFEESWPIKFEEAQYTIGIGDLLKLSQIGSQVTDTLPNKSNTEELRREANTQTVINSESRVGSDGSILLLEVGRLNVLGKTLSELRAEVRNIFIRNGIVPRFQLEISQFNSKKAYVTDNSSSSVIKLKDQSLSLRGLLTEIGKGIKPGVVTKVKLQRDKQTFKMKLRSIFNTSAPEVVIKDGDHIFIEDVVASSVISESIVGDDGYLIIEDIGKFYVLGKTIDEVKKMLSSKMEILPDSENIFQIEIIEFNSKKALLQLQNGQGQSLKITNKKLGLDELLNEAGISIIPDKVIRLELQRSEQKYSFTLSNLYKNSKTPIYLQTDDIISVEILSYKPNKVFVLGGISPQIINIDPELRQTLADILFTTGGLLSSASVKRSEVYLLRGQDPVIAYHLDAQNPTRLIVADAMELRPNDILYVAEQPISSFNRALTTVVPLRILLRDIQNQNIP